MSTLKTTPNAASVAEFIAGVAADRQEDCRTIIRMMSAASGAEPRMWGPSIVGFGSYHYTYESGREGDWMLIGFSPRKRDLTLYIMAGFSRYEELMTRLGKYRTGKSCLYVKQLSDVDAGVLQELMNESVRAMRARYT
jgi:hypothetical protein